MSKVTIRVMLNKQKTKVLFAEAGKDFTDILLSFLTLPLGKISKLLEASDVGSLSNLYRSVANLDGTHFVNEAAKLMLLDPRSSFGDVCPTLILDVANTQPTKYFSCASSCPSETRAKNICLYYGSGSCDSCRQPLLTQLSIGDTKGDDGGKGFTNNTASFVIYDDLRVEHHSTGFLQTLRSFDIGDINGAELSNFTFGIEEIIGLLKCCFLSNTPLTDLILNSQQHRDAHSADAKQSKTLKTSFKTEKIMEDDNSSKGIILKITEQKFTNRLLFAQTEADFVELLFSFLTIPLGGVESLADNNTSSKNVDNLYRSLAAIDHKYFRTPDLKSRLMNPKLAHGYSSRNQFLPLIEETAPTFYTSNRILYYKAYNYVWISVPFLKSPKGLDNYVKEPATYMVTDDLNVTPFGMALGLSILRRLNISPFDVDELVVHIGMEEVIGILRASLTTTCALSCGLINHIPQKMPKLERQLVGQII